MTLNDMLDTLAAALMVAGVPAPSADMPGYLAWDWEDGSVVVTIVKARYQVALATERGIGTLLVRTTDDVLAALRFAGVVDD